VIMMIIAMFTMELSGAVHSACNNECVFLQDVYWFC